MIWKHSSVEAEILGASDELIGCVADWLAGL